MEIEWEDPPEAKRGRFTYEFADALRANPGKWARWPGKYKGASSASATRSMVLNKSSYPAFFKGKWDAVVREGVLYMRYLGDEEDQ